MYMKYKNVGTIYVLKNKYMKGLYKIGITNRPVEQRIAEINNHEGVPYPFELEYRTEIGDYQEAEKVLHNALNKNRIHPKKEFFRINPENLKPLLNYISKSTNINKDMRQKDFRYNNITVQNLNSRIQKNQNNYKRQEYGRFSKINKLFNSDYW